MNGSVDLSIVVPVYNEGENLPLLWPELRGVLDPTGLHYEVIFVDDGSQDRSAEIIRRFGEDDPRVRLIRLKANAGETAATDAGFKAVRGRHVVVMDADLQNDPADLPRVLEALQGADVVSGIRRGRRDAWIRRVSSRIANAVRRGAIGDPVTDIGCSFKAYRREALEHLPMFVGMHRFLPALCVFRGARLVEVELSHRPRRHGVSKYGVSNRLWRGIWDLFGVRWLKSRLIRSHVREVDP